MLANPDYAIPEAYVFHNGNVSTAGKVAYLPIYMGGFCFRTNLFPIPTQLLEQNKLSA